MAPPTPFDPSPVGQTAAFERGLPSQLRVAVLPTRRANPLVDLYTVAAFADQATATSGLTYAVECATARAVALSRPPQSRSRSPSADELQEQASGLSAMMTEA